MTLGDLLVLYGVAGGVSAGVVYRAAPERGKAAWLSAALALPLWPLWLPVALTGRRKPAERERSRAPDATQAAIWEAHEAVVGSPLEPLLPREAALRMLQEVDRAGQRHRELGALLEQRDFSRQAAEERVAKLARTGATARSLAPARLHLENVRRLQELRRRDEQTLLELAELATTLRTQLVLARYAGSTPADASDILSEVWARVEVLGTTLESPQTGPFDPADSEYITDEAHTVSG